MPENLKQKRKTNWYFMKTIIKKKPLILLSCCSFGHFCLYFSLSSLLVSHSAELDFTGTSETFCAEYLMRLMRCMRFKIYLSHCCYQLSSLFTRSIIARVSPSLTYTHTHNQSCGFGVCREFKIAPSDHILVWY